MAIGLSGSMYTNDMDLILRYSLFSLVWLAIVYLIDSAIAHTWKKVELKQALAYMCVVATIGVFGEIFLDSVYNFFVGQPLWLYNLLPIHNGYTSAYAPIIWGIFGFHCYLFHDTLAKKWHITRTWQVALVLSFEALLLEAMLTLSAIPVFGSLMYYYTPNDLWHVTSLQNVPFYYICGLLIAVSAKRFKTYPLYFAGAGVFLTVVVVFFAR